MSKLTKVFVGNLAFKMREPELASAFEDVGKVLSANIITRGPRSLGYGFVEFETEEDAKKAVSAMDKKELDGRVINVEVAKEREEIPEKPGPLGGGEIGEKSGGERPPRRGSRYGRTGRGPRRPQENKEEAAAIGSEEKGQGRPKRWRRTRGKGPKPKEGEETVEKPAPRKRGRRPRIPDEEKEESKTTIFVANLPRILEDSAFVELFTNAGFKPKQTRVLRFSTGRSRGFGFVEFETEEEQKKVLEQKFTLQEQELTLKIAHFVKNQVENPEEKKEEEKSEVEKEEVKKEEEKKEEKKDAEKPAANKSEEATKKEEPKK